MKNVISCLLLFFFIAEANAQNVGINNTDPKSALDVNGGLRLRPITSLVSGTTVTLVSNHGYHFISGTPTGNFTISLLPLPSEGQHTIITNTTGFTGNVFSIAIPPATTVELFYSNGAWKQIGSSQPLNSAAWSLTGNTGAVNAVLGHTDNRPLQFMVNGQHVGRLGGNNNILLGLQSGSFLSLNSPGSANNIAIGNTALAISEASTYNIVIGHNAMSEATGGSTGIAIGGSALNKQANGALENIAIGFSSQPATTSGANNISMGRQSLFKNTTTSFNVAIGINALMNNVYADRSTAIGHFALERHDGSGTSNITENTAVGYEAMQGNANALLNTGRGNTAMGYRTMATYTSGSFSVAIGNFAMERYASGSLNVSVGYDALRGSNTLAENTGHQNVALGYRSLYRNSSASNNIAIGTQALSNNSSGYSNVAIGTNALFTNNSKNILVAIGDSAMYFNGAGATLSTHAVSNTAIGSKSLYKNTVGSYNTAVGINSLLNNTIGNQNTALGLNALSSNIAGHNNVALGSFALRTSNGNNNIGIGASAGFQNSSGSNNIAIGTGALSVNASGSSNIAIGSNAGFNELGSDKLYIETTSAGKNDALIYGDFAADSLLLNAKTINKFSLNIRGSNPLEMGYGAAGKQTDAGRLCYGCFGDPAHWLGIVGGGTAALGGDRVIKLWSEGGLRIKGNALPNTDNGHSLGQSGLRWSSVWAVNGVINTSDANLKTNILNSPYGLNEIMQMKPVQYNWKTNPDEDLQIGFLAQDIQKIIPEAVVVPANGDPLGMKYSELIPVLVKAIQEQQKRIDELEQQIKKMKK